LLGAQIDTGALDDTAFHAGLGSPPSTSDNTLAFEKFQSQFRLSPGGLWYYLYRQNPEVRMVLTHPQHLTVVFNSVEPHQAAQQ
jgi:hypothetical protein